MSSLGKTLTSIALAILLAGAGVAANAEPAVQAVTPPPAELPDAVRGSLPPGQELHLLGYGHFHKWLSDVFDASLWVSGTQWSNDQPFALELRYLRKFTSKDIVSGAMDQWRHLGYSDPRLLDAWKQKMSEIFPDVKVGDQLLGLYTPGAPTRFFCNGTAIGEVDDPAFGPAFFAIWLDRKTSQPDLRQALLGEDCTKSSMIAKAEATPCSSVTIPSAQPPKGG